MDSLAAADRTAQAVHEGFATYRFDHAAQAIYEFIWNEYCDWYLELCKPVLLDDGTDARAKAATRRNLVATLESVLRLAHPIVPFITEAIWQRVAPIADMAQADGDHPPTVTTRPLPSPDPALVDAAATAEVEWLKAFILGIRSIRGAMDLPPSKQVPVLIENASPLDQARTERHGPAIRFLARVESLEILAPGSEAPESSTALLGDARLLIPLAGLIDKAAEEARLDREIQKLRKDLQKAETKLANPSFVERAPEAVVSKERARADDLRAGLGQLEEQVATLARLG